jgi:hypothetical protein
MSTVKTHYESVRSYYQYVHQFVAMLAVVAYFALSYFLIGAIDETPLAVMLVFFATVALGAFIFACYTIEDGIFSERAMYIKWSRDIGASGYTESPALTNMVHKMIQSDGVAQTLCAVARRESKGVWRFSPPYGFIKHGDFRVLITSKCNMIVAVNGDLMLNYPSVEEAAHDICRAIYKKANITDLKFTPEQHQKIAAYK